MWASAAICATSATYRISNRPRVLRSRPASSISGAGPRVSRSVGRSFGSFGSFATLDWIHVLNGPNVLRFQPPDLFPLSSIGLEGHTSVQREWRSTIVASAREHPKQPREIRHVSHNQNRSVLAGEAIAYPLGRVVRKQAPLGGQ